MKPGDQVAIGQRIGLYQVRLQVDVDLPKNADIKVKAEGIKSRPESPCMQNTDNKKPAFMLHGLYVLPSLFTAGNLLWE